MDNTSKTINRAAKGIVKSSITNRIRTASYPISYRKITRAKYKKTIMLKIKIFLSFFDFLLSAFILFMFDAVQSSTI
jgi:hypothetical protein